MENKLNIDVFNKYLLDIVIKNGIGTKETCAKLAVAFITGVYSLNKKRLPYSYGGGHKEYSILGKPIDDFYGVDPNWGKINNYHNEIDGITFENYGMDCSSFIYWLFKNSGIKCHEANSVDMSNYGEKFKLSNKNILAQPGDLIWRDGHIMMVVETNYDTDYVFIAHQNGKNGLRINRLSIYDTTKDNYLIKMDDFYKNSSKLSKEELSDFYKVNYF